MLRRYRMWRLRPGLLKAAEIAEAAAWSHPNARMLGPEQNLNKLAAALRALINGHEVLR